MVRPEGIVSLLAPGTASASGVGTGTLSSSSSVVGGGYIGGPTATVTASIHTGAGRSRSPRSVRGTSPSTRSLLGTAEYKPSIAGSANKPGGVYDRLSSPDSFTGVYRRAWLTDGRINHFTDTGTSAVPSAFEGHTNTRSNEVIHHISHLLRPNLRVGKTFK